MAISPNASCCPRCTGWRMSGACRLRSRSSATSRTPLDDEAFREKMRDSVKQFLEDSPFDEDLWTSFARNLYYVAGDLNDRELYAQNRRESSTSCGRPTCCSIFRRSPATTAPLVDCLGAAGLAQAPAGAWRRIVIEKPFGHDLESAIALNEEIHKVVPENEVYRIDHYLGKETVQNILAFRFGNGIFEPLWNRRYVNHVQITAAESIGVEGRGAYYQEAGALRDMIQNHLLQVMPRPSRWSPRRCSSRTRCAMSAPSSCARSRSCIRRKCATNAVAGQYRGFREEPGVDADSQTDTFAAATFFIDNWRWAGVPFYIRSGKKLPKRVTDIAIQFNDAPHAMFASETRRRAGAAESADRAHPAGRGDFAAVSFEATRQRDAAAPGVDGFQLRIEFRRAVAHRVRNAAGGRDDRATRRCTRVRTWWKRAGAWCSRFSTTGARANSIFRTTSRARGVRRKPTDAGAARTSLEEQLTAAVDPEKILKDLRELWVDLGREQESGVLRACAMTLMVIAEDASDAENARRTLGVLMHDHPSRAHRAAGHRGRADRCARVLGMLDAVRTQSADLLGRRRDDRRRGQPGRGRASAAAADRAGSAGGAVVPRTAFFFDALFRSAVSAGR